MHTDVTSRDVAKRKTCKRDNKPGHAHSLTFCCFRNQPFLLRERARGWLLDAIEQACDTHDLDLWAYVVMPEHVHILIHPRSNSYDISGILSSFKQPVSKRARLYVNEKAPAKLVMFTDRQPNGKSSFRFWQRGGGYDRNLWSPKYVWETIDYIHENPVRRQLCERNLEWKCSSAAAYAGFEDGLLKINLESLPDDPRRINAV